MIKAPFTPEQVQKLFEWQFTKHVHPFTCKNRGDGKHTYIGHDHGTLIPTINGWVCPFCEYTQDWAHEGMVR